MVYIPRMSEQNKSLCGSYAAESRAMKANANGLNGIQSSRCMGFIQHFSVSYVLRPASR
jgi:hypothetical protein